MSVSSIVIDACPKDNLDLLLECVRDLNRRLNARLSGVSYAWPNSNALGALVASPFAASREEAHMKAQLAGARRAFEAAFPELQSEEFWCEGIGEPAGQMLGDLFCADLLATIEPVSGPCVQVDPIEIAVHSGTPVLRVRQGVNELPLKTAVVAWKDGASANRALRAARPLLILAGQIHVIGVGDEVSIERLEQVAAFLRREGGKVEASHLPRTHSNPGAEIMHHALALDADLVVSGVKGERSLRDWVLGDVTDKLAGYAGFSWFMCA